MERIRTINPKQKDSIVEVLTSAREKIAAGEKVDIGALLNGSGINVETIDAALKYIRIEEARQSFDAFYSYCFEQEQSELHKVWDSELKHPPGVPGGGEENRVLIEAPRGFAKTTWATRKILFCLGHNPDLLVTYVTGDDELANLVGEEIATHIESNDRLHEVFPNLVPDKTRWSKGSRNVPRNIIAKDPSLRFCGIFSTGTGGRSHMIIFDDITSFRTSVQHPGLRENLKRIFSDVWMKYLLPGGVALVICTPWHVGDVVAGLEASKSWKLIKIPALNEKMESNWPEFWPTDVLLAEMEEDPESFARQKMLKPMSGVDVSFDYKVIESCFVARDHISPDWPRYVGVDLSPSLGGKGCWNSIFVVAVDPAKVRHVDQILRFKGESVEVIEQLIEIYNRTHFVLCVVENNAYQAALIPFIETFGTGMPLYGYRSGAQKFDMRQGVPSLHAQMKQGLWVFEYSSEHEAPGHTCNMCVLIEELTDFPHGKHSDVLMSLWLATKAIDRCELTFDYSDRTEDHTEIRDRMSASELLDNALEGGEDTEITQVF
jgi:hypothetical protein